MGRVRTWGHVCVDSLFKQQKRISSALVLLSFAGAGLGPLIALPVTSTLQSPVDNLISTGPRGLIGIRNGEDLRGNWHVEYDIEGRKEIFDIKLKQIGSRVWGNSAITVPSEFSFKLQGRFVDSVLTLNWIDADLNGISHGVFLGTLDTDRKHSGCPMVGL